MKFPSFSAIFSLALIVHQAAADDVGVRLRLGLEDKEAADWSGTVSVSPGRVTLIGGWRFAQTDKIEGTTGWSCRTRPQVATRPKSNNPKRAAAAATRLPIGDNGVLISFTDVTEDSQVTVKTAQGEFAFALRDVPPGKIVEQLGGAVEAERTASSRMLASEKTDDDYPSAAMAPDGTMWIAHQSYEPGVDRGVRAKSYDKEPEEFQSLAKAPGADRLWLRSDKGGEPIGVTAAGRDIYKSAVAVDAKGTVWVAWAENSGYAPFPKNAAANFDIWARAYDPKAGKLGEAARLSESPESDVWPVAATDSTGAVWIAWQGARNGVFRIFERHRAGEAWSAPREVSAQKGNCWAPAIAAGKSGIAIAWDTYEKGDYDVWVREFKADGQPGEARPVANTPDYEARPALTFDGAGALWISWEQSGPTWGKDWGALERESGIGLYRDRQIGLAVLKDGQWMQTAASVTTALPSGTRKRQRNQRVPAIEPGAETRKAGEEAEAAKNFAHNNLARIVADTSGRVWVFSRSRQNDFRGPIGSVWLNWAAYCDGDQWVGPILVPHSDNLLYNTPAVVPTPDGGLAIAHSSDHRQDRHLVGRKQGGGNSALDADNDPFDNDLYISRLKVNGGSKPAQLVAAKTVPAPSAQPSADTQKERAEVARLREYRADVGGKSLRILRGEFHRHTEISGDGGNDGPLEDMWRYAVDVAAMDWLGCGDHDNGGGREYPWWLTQKTTDAFTLPGAFTGMYTYERSVRYPEGHRNVVFARRGVRTLPRLPKVEESTPGHAPDTQMLYKYLRHFDGVCASHTSATDMGTDWRDWDPLCEPMVEIYQGARQNYERPGAPRCPTENDAIGGWRPEGFVNLAFAKGYRMAFQSSSDHGSTHISYALVYAEAPTREAIVASMKKRQIYAATDNIIADFRCGAHMMGEEFAVKEPPKFRIHLEGTAPFKRVVFVKDDVEIFTSEPNQAKCDLEWTDPNPVAGKTSYYYVRGEQQDGELVWASPMWVKFESK